MQNAVFIIQFLYHFCFPFYGIWGIAPKNFFSGRPGPSMTGSSWTNRIRKPRNKGTSWLVGREFQPFDVHSKTIRTFSNTVCSCSDPLRQNVTESFPVGNQFDSCQTGFGIPKAKFEAFGLVCGKHT